MNRKEQWIEDVMNSLQHVRQAAAPPALQQRILNELSNRQRGQLRISRAILWPLAAGLLLLISMNVFSMVHFNKQQRQTAMKETSIEVMNEYFTSVSN